jgi:hypothetical protein
MRTFIQILAITSIVISITQLFSCSYSEAPCPGCNKIFKSENISCPHCQHKTLKFIDKKTLQCKCSNCDANDIYLDHPTCGYTH